MDQQTFNLIIGLATFMGAVGFIVISFLQHNQIQALIKATQTVNADPAVIAAIKGATEGVPQQVFNQALATLAAAKSFAPTDDWKTLVDALTKFTEKIDNDPSNDPDPDPTGQAAPGNTGGTVYGAGAGQAAGQAVG